MVSVAYLRGGGIGRWPPCTKDFLAPKCRIKRRLTGYLILRKITKFVATRCQILRLKCTKFDSIREGRAGEWDGKREGRKREGM